MVIDRNVPRGETNEDIWRPPILPTIALNGTGVPEVLEAITAHREHLRTSGLWANREQARIETELLNVLRQELLDRLLARVGDEWIQAQVERIAAREVDVYTTVQTILDA
jgi:LAO/AO transport system kinase